MEADARAKEVVAQARKARGAQPGFAAWALFYAVLVGAALLAWPGTWPLRLTSAGVVLLCFGFLGFLFVRDLRRRWDLEGELIRGIRAADPELAERVRQSRALSVECERSPSTGSPLLARAHRDRVLREVDLAHVRSSHGRRRTRLAWAGLAFAVAASAGIALEPVRLLEGLDVLATVNKEAPVPIPFLRSLSITVRQPAYLGRGERTLFPGATVPLPVGSEIRYRGEPLRDRTLFLTDGTERYPFRSDGAGGVVAHFRVSSTTQLWVVAEFGTVSIRQPGALSIVAERDTAPQVALHFQSPGGERQTAPGSLRLSEGERVTLTYKAEDDHGLRRIALKLRAGAREETRVLRRLDGGSTSHEGAVALSAKDKFIRRAAGLPVEVVVVARDNDGVDGSKWGQSPVLQVVTVVPGADEAERLSRLTDLRSDLSQRLAVSMEQGVAAANLAAFQERTREAFSDEGSPAARRLGMFVRAQSDKLNDLPKDSAAALERMETVLLALDSGVRRLSWTDARAVSKRLSELAAQVAVAARRGRDKDENSGGEGVELPLSVLWEGARQLKLLGELGRDIGSVAEADLSRLNRVRDAGSLSHVEAVARHIAGRLHHAAPSFGAKGGSGKGGGGVEAGHGEAEPGSEGEASEAYEAFEELARELDDLARDHDQAMQEQKPSPRAASEERAFSDRAEELMERAGEAGAQLPRDVQEQVEGAKRDMRRAAERFEQGDATGGRRAQEDAQEQLDRAVAELSSDSDDPSGDGDGSRDESKSGVDVPESDEDGSRKFRERVVRGLNESGQGRLAPAVRRYQEGLLR